MTRREDRRAETGAVVLREDFETEKSRYNRNMLRVLGICYNLRVRSVDL
jgi:hypothetical protein